MKKSLIALCIMLATLFVITSCGEGGEQTPSHSHTFSTVYSQDETHHWFAADCGHTDVKASEGEHVDADNDGVCDVCAYDYNHTHDYADEWTTDDTYHWHAADCGHATVSDKAEHDDADLDGKCDICAWEDAEHTHKHESAWTVEGTTEADHKHYHKVDCSHTGIGNKDEGAFTDADKNGVCDVCEWYDEAHTHQHDTAWTTEGTTEADHKHYHKVACGHDGIGKKDEGSFADSGKDGVCDVCGWSDAAHKHTFNTSKWESDTTHHWHAASCGHTGLTQDKAAHTDGDGNSECDVCKYDYNHTHTFDTSRWESDEKQHWHPASCAHSTVKDAVADHKDDNKDGRCDVCDWFDASHTHTYKDEWTVSGTTVGDHKHWHDVSCDHTGIGKKDEGAMVDADNDGVCDVCATVVCTHTYDADRFVYDLTHHWHPITCGHNLPESAKVAHEDSDGNGRCDACGGVTSIEQVVADSTDSDTAAKVQSGTITVQNGSAVTTYEYRFGTDFLYYKETYGDSYKEYWYTVYNDGKSVMGMYSDNGGAVVENPNEYSLTNLQGAYIVGDFVGYVVNFYGVEDMIYKFANLKVEAGDNAEGVGDVIYDYDSESDTFTVKTTYNDGTVVYSITASFKVNADNVITDMTVNSTAGSRTFTVTVAQTVGERTEKSPYDPMSGLISDFVIKDLDGNVIKDGDTIHVPVGEKTQFPVTITPEDYDTVKDRIKLVNNHGFKFFYSSSGKYLQVTANNGSFKVGEAYEITLTSNLHSITFYVIADPKAPTSFQSQVTEIDGGYTTTDSYTVLTGTSIGVSAVVGADEDNGFTAEVIEGTATTFEWDEENGYYVFMAETAGVYKIRLTSTKDASFTATLTVTVSDVPTFNAGEVLNGRYETDFYGLFNTFTFFPASEGATEGVLWYNDLMNSKTNAGVYSYKYLDGMVELYKADGTVFTGISITVNESTGAVSCGFASTKVESITAEDVLYGKYVFANAFMGDFWGATFYPDAMAGSTSGLVEIEAIGQYAAAEAEGTYRYSFNGESLSITTLDGTALNANIGLAMGADLQLTWGAFIPRRCAADASSVLNGSYDITTKNGDSTVVFDYEAGTMTVTGAYNGTYTFSCEGNVVTVEDGAPAIYLTPGMIFSKFDGQSSTEAVKFVAGAVDPTPSEPTGLAALDGKYELDFYGNILYEFIFDREAGTLEILDLNGGVLTGSYTYTATHDTLTVYDAYGAEVSAFFGLDMGGNPTFYGGSLGMAQPITPVSGGSEGGEEEDDTVQLQLGANSVHVTIENGWSEEVVAYFSAAAGSYTIAPAEGETNHDIYIVLPGEEDPIWIENYPYVFTVEDGQTVEFRICSSNWMASEDDIDFVISEASEDDLKPNGSEDRPFEATVPGTITTTAGGPYVYYTFTSTEDGILSLDFDTDDIFAFVGIKNSWDNTYLYGDGTAEIVGGNTYILAISTNSGDTLEITTVLDFNAQKLPTLGEFAKPEELYTGENGLEYASEGEYYWYIYTPYVGGSVTFTFTGEGAYMLKYGSDKETLVETSEKSVTVEVTEGVSVYFGIKTADGSAATITYETTYKGLPGSDSNPIEVTVGESYVATYYFYTGTYYSYTATENGYLVLTFDKNGSAISYGTESEWGLSYYDSYDEGKTVYEIAVTAGTTYGIVVNDASYMDNTFNFSISYSAESVGGGEDVGGDEPVVGDGSFTVTVTDEATYTFDTTYTFTADVAGTYTLYVPAGVGIGDKAVMDNRGEPWVLYFANENGETVDIELAAGEEITFAICSAVAGDVVFTYSVTEGEVGGDVGGGDEPTESVKDANGLGGEYVIDYIMSGAITLTFTPSAEGSVIGTLDVVDFLNGKNSGSFTYEIVDGAYVFYLNGEVTNAVIVSHDPASWTFQNASILMAQVFAPYTAS